MFLVKNRIKVFPVFHAEDRLNLLILPLLMPLAISGIVL